jgi:hypothetical protein
VPIVVTVQHAVVTITVHSSAVTEHKLFGFGICVCRRYGNGIRAGGTTGAEAAGVGDTIVSGVGVGAGDTVGVEVTVGVGVGSGERVGTIVGSGSGSG